MKSIAMLYSFPRKTSALGAVIALFCSCWLSVGWAEIRVSSDEDKARNGHIQEIEFKDARVQDAIRVISELTGVNIIATNPAGEEQFNLFLRDVSVADAIDSIARVAGLWYRKNPDSGVFMVMTTEEYLKDIIVFREERTQTFTLKYQNVVTAAQTIEAIFGDDRVELELNTENSDLEIPGATLSTSRNTAGSSNRSGRTTGASRSRSVSGQRNRTNNRRGQNELDMTAEQISLMERSLNAAAIQVSEKDLSRVRKDSQSPIFVSVNREHNLLFVRTADETAMQQIVDVIRESDRPTPQVLLEMKVISVKLDEGAQSAFDFSLNAGGITNGVLDGQAPNPLSPTTQASKVTLGLVNSALQASNTAVFQILNEHVRLRMQMLEEEGRVNVLSTPMLLASNNRAAKIFIGEETVVTTGFTATTGTGGGNNNTFIAAPVPVTEKKDVGNTLTILPSINADRTVLMRVLQESSRLVPGGGRIPLESDGIINTVSIDTIDKSTLEGTVMAKDGLTVVVGGMITETDSDNERKVPLLGDVPLLGEVFRDTERSQDKQELVLLITPHVFTTPEEAERLSRERLKVEAPASSSVVEVYTDRLTGNRPQIRKPIDDRSAAQRAEDRQKALLNFAARAERDHDYVRSHPQIRRVEVDTGRALQLHTNSAVIGKALTSWQEGDLYVSAVELTNTSSQSVSLHSDRLLGGWLMTAADDGRLTAGDRTVVYVVSNRPYSVLASRLKPVAKAILQRLQSDPMDGLFFEGYEG